MVIVAVHRKGIRFKEIVIAAVVVLISSTHMILLDGSHERCRIRNMSLIGIYAVGTVTAVVCGIKGKINHG